MQMGDSVGLVCEAVRQHPAPGSPLFHSVSEGRTSDGMAQWECGRANGPAVGLPQGTGGPSTFLAFLVETCCVLDVL